MVTIIKAVAYKVHTCIYLYCFKLCSTKLTSYQHNVIVDNSNDLQAMQNYSVITLGIIFD